MAFESFSDFWAMGGYGLYVWLSVGITMLGLVVLWGISVHHRHVLVKQVAIERQRRARIKAAKQKARQSIEGGSA